MELPAIKIPQIELPFDIPLLMHPPVDHFIIAIPVIVLLLEIINLIVKKRAIGIISFVLLVLTVVAAVAAYFTGSVDGKEAFPLLNEVAQGELKEHKLLGTYLMLASAVVLVFKLLSAMIGRGLMKALYLLVLILFVAGILKQGKEGGDLVYKYGVNVEKVQELDSELFDVKEELEELEEANAASEAEVPAEEIKVSDAIPETKEVPSEVVPAEVKEVPVAEVKEDLVQVAPVSIETPVETVVESLKSEVEEKSESAEETVQESIKAVEEKVEEVKVEVIPQEIPVAKIATH